MKKQDLFRKSLNAVAFIIATVASNLAVAADLSPNTVKNHSEQYDGQDISVVGTISAFRARVSRSGNAYETFKLCDENACLDVFAWGNESRTEGARISVSGHFFKVKRVGRYTFYNELDLD